MLHVQRAERAGTRIRHVSSDATWQDFPSRVTPLEIAATCHLSLHAPEPSSVRGGAGGSVTAHLVWPRATGPHIDP